MNPEIIKAIRELQEHVYQIAKSKGWHEKERSPLEYHALIHSEVAEATEEAREAPKLTFEGVTVEWDPIVYDASEKPCGEMIEIADVIIRCLDYAASRGWDLAEAIRIKATYNETRPHRHGGKKY